MAPSLASLLLLASISLMAKSEPVLFKRDVLPIADTLFVNGNIHTLNSTSKTIKGGALAVTNGTITCVGDEQTCRPAVGGSTKVVDLNGKTMIPGLIDTHIHPIDGGRAMLGCTLRFKQLTQQELRRIIQACLDSQPGATDLLTVTEFDREGFTSINGPGNKAMLDSLNTTRPIAIIASSQHNVFVNSRALQVLNITRNTPDPAGGKIGRDAKGELTGFLEENASGAARALGGDRGIPVLNASTAALSQLRQKGITTFFDALQTRHDAWTTLKREGSLTARVFTAFGIFGSLDFPTIISQALAAKEALDEKNMVANAPGQHWRHVKFFVDGILTQVSQSSLLVGPYLDENANGTWVPGNNTGIRNGNEEQLRDIMTRTLAAGLNMHIHASGDEAVRSVLDIATAMNKKFAPSEIGIAHAELVRLEDRKRFGELGIPVIASYQWAQRSTYWADKNALALGPERMTRVEPHGILSNEGATISYGSDWPVEPLDPFLALSIAVNRKGDPTNKNAHASFGPKFVGRLDNQPGLSRETALRGMTTAAATYLNVSDRLGSLEVGKFADLLIIDRDYLDVNAVPDEELARNKVLLTMVGGRPVFADNSTSFMPNEWLAESNRLDSNPIVKSVKPGNILSRSITGRSCGSHAGHAH